MATINKIDGRAAAALDKQRLDSMLADPRVRTAAQPSATTTATRPAAGSAIKIGSAIGKAIGEPMIAKRAIALSGGGAKGSFQVGALEYLYEERKIRPQIVTGTSVGAVNGVKLAEGETKDSKTPGHITGFAGLQKSWLDVKGAGDMFVEKAVFKQLMAFADSADELAAELETGLALSIAAAFVGGPLAWAGAGTMAHGLSNLAEAAELVDKFLYVDGLVSLAPVLEKLHNPAHLDNELVRSSNVDFRAIWVGMLSGKTYCTDNQQRLYELANPRKPIGTVTRLSTSVLASAAQPVFMDTPIVEGEIGGVRFKEKGFDGGVREIVGVQCAIELGATEVFAILCQPLDPGLGSIFEQTVGEDLPLPGGGKVAAGTKYFNATKKKYEHILTQADRALGLALTEVLDNDIAAAGNANVHVIRPYVEVHDGMTLVPGLIRANMAHGWMCAFDLFHDETKNPISFLAGGNRLITENRALKEKFVLARNALAKLGPLSPVAAKLQALDTAIAECNARIKQGIALRRAIDPNSLPAEADKWDD
jgi:hypothetical protein